MDSSMFTDTNYFCSAGFYCQLGAETVNPAQCPAGFYCPSPDPELTVPNSSGTSRPRPCPPGTYSGSLELANLADCLPCEDKQYCPDYGTTQPTYCAEGWYCEKDADPTNDKNEVTPMPSGKLCPVGSFCTGGGITACGVGMYQDREGQTSCVSCPAGYQCPPADVSVSNEGASSKKICGNNQYCPAGINAATPCDTGKYT